MQDNVCLTINIISLQIIFVYNYIICDFQTQKNFDELT